jgi:hypothetical protein
VRSFNIKYRQTTIAVLLSLTALCGFSSKALAISGCVTPPNSGWFTTLQSALSTSALHDAGYSTATQPDWSNANLKAAFGHNLDGDSLIRIFPSTDTLNFDGTTASGNYTTEYQVYSDDNFATATGVSYDHEVSPTAQSVTFSCMFGTNNATPSGGYSGSMYTTWPNSPTPFTQPTGPHLTLGSGSSLTGGILNTVKDNALPAVAVVGFLLGVKLLFSRIIAKSVHV